MSDDGDRPGGGAGDESASALASPPDPPAGGPADSGGGGAGSAADNKPAAADPPAGDDADDEDDAALAEMMALQESPPDEDDGALLAEHDPNVAFLGDDGGDGDGMGDAPNPNADNPAALALRARRRAADEARDRAADRAAARPYLVRKVLGLVPQRYTTLSILAALALFHHTLRTRGQFYLTVVYLQSSKLGYVLMGNALVALAVGAYGALTGFFLGGTRTNEREDVGERIRWDVTETCLALTIFRSELDVVTAVTFIGLVLLKCLHWSCELRGNHIRMTEEVFRYPDEDDADHERNGNTPEENLRLAWYRRLPSARLSHLKFYAFLQLLLFCDILAVAQCALSVATKGPSVDILFGFEAAILLVSALMTQGLYHLHVVDGVMGVFAHLAEGSHHHNAIGELAEASEHGGSDEATREGEGAGDRDQAQQQQQQQPKSFAKLFVERMANPWRDRRATLSFAIELQAQAAKFLFYVVFFAIVFTYYGMPINIFREVYVSFQQLRRRLIAFNTYRRLTHNMESRFDDIESEEELDRLGRTCIICREQMDLSGGCKKLPCGHAFHTHCLREWLVQQQTCPTCRSDIIAGEKRLKKQREREAAEAAAQAEADVAAAEQNVAQTAEAGANARSTQGASESEAGELDDGWTSHVDPGSGRTYYFNQSSNVSTWTRPAKPSAAKASDSPPPEAPSARSQGISTPQPEGVRAESKDEARPAATTAGFPCLYRVTCPTGAPVHPDNGLVATRVVPGNKIIVCTSLEYWPPPLEQAMLRMPDGYVRSADVERFLQLGSLRTEGQKQPVAAT